MIKTLLKSSLDDLQIPSLRENINNTSTVVPDRPTELRNGFLKEVSNGFIEILPRRPKGVSFPRFSFVPPTVLQKLLDGCMV